MDAQQETKDFLIGYSARAQAKDRAFTSLGGFAVVPDEENKKLLITQAKVDKGGEKGFICYKCDDLTSLENARNVNINEKKQCIHAMLAFMLFANLEIRDLDSTKSTIDVLKHNEKEIIALVIPCTDQKRPGVLLLHIKCRQ